MRLKIVGAVGLVAAGILFAGVLARRMPTEAEAPGAGARSSPKPQPRSSTPEEEGSAGPTRDGAERPGIPAMEIRKEGPIKAPSPEAFPDLAAVRAARRAVEEFWEDLGALLEVRALVDPDRYREELMSRTVGYLGLDPSRASLFQSAAVQAVNEIQNAWKLRETDVFGLPPWLGAEDRARKEQEIQERYEAAKQQATDRVELLLGTTSRHDRFRQRLGEWIDAVR